MKLSIVIPTKDRNKLLLETLTTIIPQLRDGVELAILDASSDFPNQLVAKSTTPHVRYEQGKANSFDSAYDEAVAAARGEWVWLFSDDDWFKPGAVETVLANLDDSMDLLIINSEVRDREMGRVLLSTWVDLPTRYYPTGDYDRMFADVAGLGTFLGSTVIRRSVWEARLPDARRYFGTRFLTFVIPFLAPTPTKFLKDVLVSARFGHQNWVNTIPQLIGVTMAEVVWSLPLAEWAKVAVRPRHPSMSELLLWRALGCDVSMHSRLFAFMPQSAARAAARLGLKLKGRAGGISDYMLTVTK